MKEEFKEMKQENIKHEEDKQIQENEKNAGTK